MSDSRTNARSSATRRSLRRSALTTSVIVAALLLPVGLATVLLIQNRRAQSRQQAIVQNALHEYAAVAAWQFTRRVGESLHDVAIQATHRVSDLVDAQTAGRNGLATREPATLLVRDSTFTTCSVLAKARFAFRIDVQTRLLVVTDSSIGRADRNALVERAIGAARGGPEPHRVIIDTIAGVRRVVALAIIHGADKGVKTIYGVVADSGAVDAAFEAAAAAPGLLPPALLGDTVPGRHLRIVLESPTGSTLFAFGSAAAASQVAIDSARINGEGPPFVAAVAIDPLLASSLVGGGLARASWPALLSLLAATLLISVAAAFQLLRGSQLSRLRTEFVANVSHELRTPLAQISMFAETLMLNRERSPAERRHYLAVIHREAGRLTNLVERVMQFAAFDTDRAALAIEPCDVAHGVRETVDAFQAIAAAADVRITVDAAGTVACRVDVAAVHQAVLNLLDNAVKHGGRGCHVWVGVAQHKAEVEIVVEDDGPGIPMDDVERVFQPFTRLGAAGARRVPGAGIGLAVVREVSMAHGGSVHVERSSRGGARFVMRLPTGNPHSDDAAAEIWSTVEPRQSDPAEASRLERV
jgi:signal transduction histidine kinase